MNNEGKLSQTVQNSTFVEILHGNVDKSVPVVVYNSKTEQSRGM